LTKHLFIASDKKKIFPHMTALDLFSGKQGENFAIFSYQYSTDGGFFSLPEHH
jgi:hypothetical protein